MTTRIRWSALIAALLVPVLLAGGLLWGVAGGDGLDDEVRALVRHETAVVDESKILAMVQVAGAVAQPIGDAAVDGVDELLCPTPLKVGRVSNRRRVRGLTHREQHPTISLRSA